MTIKECGVCYENIHCFDDVVLVDDKVYHVGCVQFSAIKIAVFDGYEFLGVSEEFNVCAYGAMNEGEYEEETE